MKNAGARPTTWALHPDTLAAIAALARSGTPAGEPELEAAAALRGGGATTGGVALLPLRGLITPRPSFFSVLFGGGAGLVSFRTALRDAVSSDDVSAIVLDIDSPGGSTDLVAETAAEIRAARQVKPVVAVANTWAASAAYWLGAQADELVVTPSGEVGSIGVLCMHEDISGMEESLGIKTTVLSAGKHKADGNPHEPLSDDAREALQAKVDEFYGLFVADVAKGRGVAPAAVRGGYGEGRMLPAKQALEQGMVDRVDTLESTVAKLVRNPTRIRRRAEAGDPAIAAAAATTPPSEGDPDPNPAPAGEQERARPSDRYIDLMFPAER